MRLRFACGFASILSFSAPLCAGNIAFKLNHALVFAPGTASNNWFSLPYFHAAADSIELCTALNDGAAPPAAPKIARIVRWDPITETPTFQRCDSTFGPGFPIVPGEAYSLVPSVTGVVANVVGAHDDNYAPNKGGTSRVPLDYVAGIANHNWVSFPYHMRADSSLDLCLELNGGPTPTVVASIVRWNAFGGVEEVQDCGSPVSAFFLIPAEAYALVPTGAGQSVAASVYGLCDTPGIGNLLRAEAVGADVSLDFTGAPGSAWEVYRDSLKTNLCSTLLLVTPVPAALDPGAISGPPPLSYYGVLVQ